MKRKNPGLGRFEEWRKSLALVTALSFVMASATVVALALATILTSLAIVIAGALRALDVL